MPPSGQADLDRPKLGDPVPGSGTRGKAQAVSVLVAALRLIDRLRNTAIIGLFAVMTVTYFTVLSSRYIPAIGAVNWAEELTRYLNIWMLFLAFGYVLRRHQHIGMDAIVGLLPPGIQRGLWCVNDGLLLVFLVVLGFYGVVMVELNMTQEAPSLKLVGVEFLLGWQVRMGWPYLAIPVGAILTALDLVAIHVDPDLRRKLAEKDALDAPAL